MLKSYLFLSRVAIFVRASFILIASNLPRIYKRYFSRYHERETKPERFDKVILVFHRWESPELSVVESPIFTLNERELFATLCGGGSTFPKNLQIPGSKKFLSLRVLPLCNVINRRERALTNFSFAKILSTPARFFFSPTAKPRQLREPVFQQREKEHPGTNELGVFRSC